LFTQSQSKGYNKDMILIFKFLFGLIIGSFLNVLGLRWNSGVTIGGRSFCVVCKKQLRWWELVPVISFISLNGRCSKCKTKISWQYPLVELWTALLFISITNYAVLIVFCIYVVITIYDARHKIIPDVLSYSTVIIALVYRFYVGGSTLDWFAGPILFGFFGLIWFISKGRAMGFGDAKLSLSIGLLIGAPNGFSALVLAFVVGSVVSLAYMIVVSVFHPLFKSAKKLTMKSEIPFAPFLIFGAWIALIYNLDLFHVLTLTK
jgi:prepilin signal peptidase PulO-like enzyme (type II secretory pathway)